MLNDHDDFKIGETVGRVADGKAGMVTWVGRLESYLEGPGTLKVKQKIRVAWAPISEPPEETWVAPIDIRPIGNIF